jgi:hypothetical protein
MEESKRVTEIFGVAAPAEKGNTDEGLAVVATGRKTSRKRLPAA